MFFRGNGPPSLPFGVALAFAASGARPSNGGPDEMTFATSEPLGFAAAFPNVRATQHPMPPGSLRRRLLLTLAQSPSGDWSQTVPTSAYSVRGAARRKNLSTVAKRVSSERMRPLPFTASIAGESDREHLLLPTKKDSKL